MKKGLVILLNGPSSGGKTTLSRNLQKYFPAPLYYTSYDLTCGEMYAVKGGCKVSLNTT